MEAIHEAQDGRNHTGKDLVGAPSALRHKGIKLIQENDGGRLILCLPP